MVRNFVWTIIALRYQICNMEYKQFRDFTSLASDTVTDKNVFA